MFFNVRLAAFAAALSVAAVLIPSVSAWAQLNPNSSPNQDSRFALLANRSLTISDAELMSGIGAFARPSITSPPSHGSLERDPQSPTSAWIYTPDPGFFGRDGFTYRIGDRPFKAWLLVQPVANPIAGRWPTESCAAKGSDASACPPSVEPGHGMELGWWDALSTTFNLCDWEGDHLRKCVAFGVLAGSEVQTWSPLVIDVDGDGWHELALRDWVTAEVRVFTVLTNSSSTSPTGLAQVDQFLLGDSGELPLAGNWAGTPASELGVYEYPDDLSENIGVFRLEDGQGGTWHANVGSFVAQPWPLAGDWLRQGKDQVAIFDLDSRILRVTPAGGGTVTSEWIPQRGAPESVPMVTPVATARTEAVFMLFDASEGFGVFHLPQVREDEDDPLPLEVVVDPTGGPRPPAY